MVSIKLLMDSDDGIRSAYAEIIDLDIFDIGGG
jgi:hypothetical protein